MGIISAAAVVQAFFLGLGAILGAFGLKWFKHYQEEKRRIGVYEIDIMLSQIKKEQEGLNLDDLIADANKRNKGPTDPPPES